MASLYDSYDERLLEEANASMRGAV